MALFLPEKFLEAQPAAAEQAGDGGRRAVQPFADLLERPPGEVP